MLEQVWYCEESLSQGILQPTFEDFQKAPYNVHFSVKFKEKVNANVKIRGTCLEISCLMQLVKL